MKFIKKELGNYYYLYRGKVIIFWIVYGNEEIIISLEGYENRVSTEGNFDYLDNLKNLGIGAEMFKKELLKNYKEILDDLTK